MAGALIALWLLAPAALLAPARGAAQDAGQPPPSSQEVPPETSRAEAFLLGGQPQEVVALLEPRVLAAPDDLRAWTALLAARVLLVQPAEALAAAQQIERLAPGRAELPLLQASMAALRRERSAALRAVRRARGIDPSSPQLQLAERVVRYGLDVLRPLALGADAARAAVAEDGEIGGQRLLGTLVGVASAVTGGASLPFLVFATAMCQSDCTGLASDLSTIGLTLAAAALTLMTVSIVVHLDTDAWRERWLRQIER